jgi:autotransporter-associated beta strand protein
MTFSNTNPYTIAGTGTITLTDSDTNKAAINTLAGSHTVSNAVDLLDSDLTLSNAAETGLTLAGVIAGPNGLLKNGTGTTTLSGANTYSGMTTIEQGTIIASKTGALGGSEVTLNGPGTGADNISLLVDSSGGSVILSNAINVANQGTGVTTIGSSALNGSARPVQFTGPINLAKDVTLVSAPYVTGIGDRTDFSGGISGVGDVTISTATNSRIVFMGNANTFDGDVIITPGSTLQLSDGESNNKELLPVGSTVDIGAGAALKLAKGGNSETIGGLNGTGIVEAISGADRLIIDAVANAIFNGTLKDGGSTLAFTKTGAGIQTLGGNNTYTGGTVLDAGKLVTTSQTALGAGAVQLLGGTLELQSQLDIASLFWDGASKIAIPNPAAGHFVNVSSPIAITNGVNYFNLAGATLPGPVKLLAAPSVSTNALSLFGVEGVDASKYMLSYIGEALWLVPIPQPAPEYPDFTQFAGTPNEIQVAQALNQWTASNPTGDRKTVLDAMTNSGDYQNAFNQMMPSQYASLPTMAFNTANALNSSMFQRLWVTRINGRGFSASGMNLAPMQAEMGGTDDMGAFAINPSKDTKWGTFVDGNGIFANAASTGSVQNYRSQSGGVTTGASYSWTDAFATGVYVGYQGLQAEYNSGRTIDNAVRFGVFGTYDVDDFYVNALVGGAYHGYTVNRNIDFGGLNRTATGRPGAGEFDLALGTGYDFDIGDFSWGPFTTLQYTYLGVQGFNETGADSLNLGVDPYNSSSLLYTLGAQAAYNVKLSKSVILTPTVFAGWQHEFLQNGYTINSSFNTGGPAAPFNYNTGTPARDNFYGGVGATLGIGERWQATAIYSAFISSQDANSQNLYLGVGYKF